MDGRKACATCGGTGIGWDLFSCPDCDGQGSTPTQPPAPTEASARDTLIAALIQNTDLWEHPFDEAEAGGHVDRQLAALAEAGLVVVPVNSVYENLPFGQTWHDCEGCGMRFVADEDQDHLWAFEGSPVRCPHCYDDLAARKPEDQR